MVLIRASSDKVATVTKDVLLAPLYLYQGRKVKRDTVRLPEPSGERMGCVTLHHHLEDTIDQQPEQTQLSTAELYSAVGLTGQNIFNVMIIGDSAAAGVGSQTQTDALAGQLIPALQQQLSTNDSLHSRFDRLNWSLQATTGHTSFDILRQLYVLAPSSQPVDVMIISVGVNDTITNTSAAKWQQQLEDIIAIAQRKFGVHQLIFCSLPPMAQMPALPKPLNQFIGAKAFKLDKILQHVCAQHEDVHYMAADFNLMARENANGMPIDASTIFASDGFHPSPIAYGYLAQQLAALIAELITPINH